MGSTYIRHAQVDIDLEDIYSFIGRDNLVAADRVLKAAEATFAEIGRNPLIGIRSRPIHGFANYQIFYRVVSNQPEILRVIHGARDLTEALLDRE